MGFDPKEVHDNPGNAGGGGGDPTAAIAAHSADTTGVHGIADTSDLVLTDDARLTDQRVPTDNSVTSAKIADGAIVNADVNASAAIAESKLALASDAAAGTASRRTLGTAATSAAAGNDGRIQSRLWAPTGAIAETAPRAGIRHEGQTLAGGVLRLAGGVILPAGQVVTSITFVSVGAAVAPTNQWFCLVDQALNVIEKTVNDGSTAWGASAAKTLALASTYTPVSTIAVYLGVVITASTLPTIVGMTHATSGADAVSPPMCGPSTTGLTNPASLGATAAAITAGGFNLYGYVS